MKMNVSATVAALTSLGLALGATGCVTQGKYDELEQKLKTTESELEKREKTITQLQGSLQSETNKSSDLNQKAKSLEKTVSTVTQNKTELESSLNQLRGDNEKLKAALDALERKKFETEVRVAEYKDLLNKFRSLIDSGKLVVRIVDGRMVVALDSDLLFKSGSSALTPDGQKAVQEVAQLLASIPDKRFQVEGHTDNVAISSARFANNWDLAAARAISVLLKMTEAGLPETRISAASFGESKPAQSNETKEGRAANRRVEIVVIPDLSKLPGFDELNTLDRAN